MKTMKTMMTRMSCLLLCLAAAEPVRADAEAVLQKRVAGLARKISADGYQVSAKGLLAEVRVTKPVAKPVKGNKFAVRYEWVQEDFFHAVIRGATGAKVGMKADLTGKHLGIAPTYSETIAWSGKAWRIGWVQYMSRNGVWRKKPLFTADAAEALAFYREHGFTQAAKDAVRVER